MSGRVKVLGKVVGVGWESSWIVMTDYEILSCFDHHLKKENYVSK